MKHGAVVPFAASSFHDFLFKKISICVALVNLEK